MWRIGFGLERIGLAAQKAAGAVFDSGTDH